MRRLLAVLAVALAYPVPAQTNDNPFTFRFATGQVYGDMAAAAVESRDIYVGEDATINLQVEGGKGGKLWSSIGEPLPQGLSLSASSGSISGSPHASQVGIHDGLAFRATDENGSFVDTDPFALTVLAPVEGSVTSSDMLVGYGYSFDIEATGGRTPYSYSVADGSLPSGMSVSGAAVSGTPSARGVYAADIRVADANGRSVDLPFDTIVREELLTSWSLIDGYVGELYSGLLTSTGGEGPFYWEMLGGHSLPAGLNLSTGGEVSGIPSLASTRHAFTAVVVDSDTQHATAEAEISVYDPPQISSATPADAYVGSGYSLAFTSSGGKPPLSFSRASGSLPSGLSLGANGTVAGTPSEAGSTSFAIEVADDNGRTATVARTIETFDVPLVSNVPTVDAYVGTAYSFQFLGAGGKAPLAYARSDGNLPAGMSLSAAGLLSGTPSAAGTSSFTVEVSDANGMSGSRAASVTTYAVPAIASVAAADLVTEHPFSRASTVSGGKSPFTWSVSSGSLPGGLTISNDGLISGTPTTVGTFTPTIRVVDANGISATMAMTFNVEPNVVVATLTSRGTPTNVQSLFNAAVWSSSTPKKVVIPVGHEIGTNSPSYAVHVPAGWGGQLTLENSGVISGIGGTGNSGIGGNALSVAGTGNAGQRLQLDNIGTIRSGGGGGGRGGIGGSGGGGFVDNSYTARDPASGGYYSVGHSQAIAYLGPNTTYGQIYWNGTIIASGSLGSSYTQGGYTYHAIAHQGSNRWSIARTWYVSQISNTNGGAGGAFGNGGRGQGYDGANIGGGSGSAGAFGGTNAGRGGTGGSGGTGGGWGANGNTGGTGATGASGNRTGGTAGAVGLGGGLAGYAILNSGNVDYIRQGTIQGRR